MAARVASAVFAGLPSEPEDLANTAVYSAIQAGAGNADPCSIRLCAIQFSGPLKRSPEFNIQMAILSRRDFLAFLLTTSVPYSLTGCGTVLHPERRGEVSGELDWRIVGLDAPGLLLFLCRA